MLWTSTKLREHLYAWHISCSESLSLESSSPREKVFGDSASYRLQPVSHPMPCTTTNQEWHPQWTCTRISCVFDHTRLHRDLCRVSLTSLCAPCASLAKELQLLCRKSAKLPSWQSQMCSCKFWSFVQVGDLVVVESMNGSSKALSHELGMRWGRDKIVASPDLRLGVSSSSNTDQFVLQLQG